MPSIYILQNFEKNYELEFKRMKPTSIHEISKKYSLESDILKAKRSYNVRRKKVSINNQESELETGTERCKEIQTARDGKRNNNY